MSSAVGGLLPSAQVDCRWWKQGNCFRGETCRFRHDEALAGANNKMPALDVVTKDATETQLPPDQVDCMWWKRGYCYRGEACLFRHDEALAAIDTQKPELTVTRNAKGKAKATDESSAGSTAKRAGSSTVDSAHASPSSSQICTICLETPDTFGLLLNCDHVFCLECIRNWRSSTSAPLACNDELRSTSKTCPMCRSHSDYIIPSSIFPSVPANTSSDPENTQKTEIVHRYLNRLSSIPCRYFEQSVSSVHESSSPILRPKCRFGNSCHYAHIHPITMEPYIFSAEELTRRPRSHHRRLRRQRMSYIDEVALMERIMASLGHDGASDADEWGCDDDDGLELGFEGSEAGVFFDAGDVGDFLEQGMENLSLSFDLDWDELEYGWD